MSVHEDDPAGQAIVDLGLERSAIMLSEGFCVLCMGRSSSTDVIGDDDEQRMDAQWRRPSTTVTVNCATCKIRWRSGPHPENDRDWIEYARILREGMILTITVNAPPDEPDEHDEWNDWHDEEEG